MLSQLELRNVNGGSLTSAFCARVVEECYTYSGELDFKAFLDFVLAVDYRASPQSLRYMFRLFDLSKSGMLVRADIRYFMRAVLDKHSAEGHDRLDLESCVDEVWDVSDLRTTPVLRIPCTLSLPCRWSNLLIRLASLYATWSNARCALSRIAGVSSMLQ